jgi:hypothetical protein
MHRSGTSLVANVLRTAGLDIGREEFGPGLGQPRGHFEDHDFFHLHEEILAALGRTCFTVDAAALATPIDPRFVTQARDLVAAREERPFWGWKEPRTTLFLDLWEGLLPQARYLFLYRHPVDVALSLWRRNIDLEIRQDPWLAFRAWEVYNRRLLEFRNRHPRRCFLAHAPALTADLAGFVRHLSAKLDVPLHQGNFAALYDEGELAPSCPLPRPAWEVLLPDALDLYSQLERCADLTSEGEPRVEGRQRQLLQGSELLLFALLEAKRGAGPSLDHHLRSEFVRLRLQEEKLRKKLEGAPAAEPSQPEVEEGSSGFTRLRSWWRQLQLSSDG